MQANTLIAALAGLLSLGPVFIQQEAAQEDQQKLQGRWAVIRGEDDGERLVEQRIKDSSVIIQGDRIRVLDKTDQREMTFRLDPTRNPKAIDMMILEGPEKGKLCYGIYRLEGDMLTIAFAPVGKERPNSFETKPGSREMLFSMKQEK